MGTKTTSPQNESVQSVALRRDEVDHLKIDQRWDRYNAKIQTAARAGKIGNAEPLIRTLNSDMRVFTGLSVLLEIVRNNTILRDHFDAEDINSIEPLDDHATDALLNLASEICCARSQDICGLADWVEKHIESREGK